MRQLQAPDYETAELVVKHLKKCGASLTTERDPAKFIGYSISFDDDHVVKLDMHDYEKAIVAKYEQKSTIREQTLPAPAAVTMKHLQEEMLANGSTDPQRITRARSIVGAIMYLANRGAPTICAAVVRLAVTCSKPTELWFKSALHLIGHIKYRLRKKVCIRYTPRRRGEGLMPQLELITDASFDTSLNHRSMIGSVVALGGEMIDFHSSLTKIVCLSTSVRPVS